MHRLHRTLLVLLVVATGLCAGLVHADQGSTMMRYPDVSATSIVFLYGNDLWLVPRDGGVATPLASPPGEELFPRFSDDGKTLVFQGNYDGDRDLYLMSTEGGIPSRLTHNPSNEVPNSWTPDGRVLFSAYGYGDSPHTYQLFTLSTEGGLPDKLPVPYGAAASIHKDGQWMAYTPYNRDSSTWKRYRGGMASDIWLFNLQDKTSRRVTTWEGTDTQPMWHGDDLYYLSDRGEEARLNIWRYDMETGQHSQVTSFADYDIKYPSVGPGANGEGEIVFQKGSGLYLLNLGSGESHAVQVTIPGARPDLRPQRVDVSGQIGAWSLSASGKRLVVEARGDIWSLPATEGAPFNLTRTSGVAERDPLLSPDGEWVVYFSDRAGSYDLYRQPAGGGKEERLTRQNFAYLYAASFSPDSKHYTFWRKDGTLMVMDMAGKTLREVDRDPFAQRSPVSFSPDSNWMAFHILGDNQIPHLKLYDLKNSRLHQVTSGMFGDSSPVFDREGKYLFFASHREFSGPVYETLGTTFVYRNTQRLYGVTLQKDGEDPFAAGNDTEEAKKNGDNGDNGEAGKKDKKKGKDGGKKESKKTVIDLAGFAQRVFQLPVERGAFGNLAVNDAGHLLYGRYGSQEEGPSPGVKLFDMSADEPEEASVFPGRAGFTLSADGKKMALSANGKMAVVKTQPDQKMKKPVPTAGMESLIDPRQEWRQVFTEAWRLYRDFFYDPTMHGVDWERVKNDYARMIEDCSNRDEVTWVIKEMISELNVGHAYYYGGTVESQPSKSVGMLGCDFKMNNGGVQISRIYTGGPWDVDARGPLSRPGVDVNEGDYLLAVNGVPMSDMQDPWQGLVGTAGRPTVLTVNAAPAFDGKEREVVVKPLQSESSLRYRAWVESRRAYVDKVSGGKVGYIHVPDTGINGQNNLLRQFYGQTHKEALIIDERWNGGGQIPTRFVELLNRPVANYWALRDSKSWTWPPDAHHGPKCMLINGLAGSGGDYFPYWFRKAGVGKLIGTRTWGGLVGISGNPGLIDGGYVSVPRFAFYETDGTWGIEGHGVDPDIEVVDDPALMTDGGDPQLDRAIEEMLKEIEARPHVPVPVPGYPDRSGLGLDPADQ